MIKYYSSDNPYREINNCMVLNGYKKQIKTVILEQIFCYNILTVIFVEALPEYIRKLISDRYVPERTVFQKRKALFKAV